jgi:hypothetical protein
VVVGRGCLGRPWLFRDLVDAFAGRPLQDPPDLGAVAAMMRIHAELLCDAFGPNLGIRQFRKHTGWYLTGFPVGSAVRRSLAQASTLTEVGALLDGLDPTLPFPVDALRVARGHTNGPRPVHVPAGWMDAVDDPRPPAGGDLAVSGG